MWKADYENGTGFFGEDSYDGEEAKEFYDNKMDKADFDKATFDGQLAQFDSEVLQKGEEAVGDVKTKISDVPEQLKSALGDLVSAEELTYITEMVDSMVASFEGVNLDDMKTEVMSELPTVTEFDGNMLTQFSEGKKLKFKMDAAKKLDEAK